MYFLVKKKKKIVNIVSLRRYWDTCAPVWETQHLLEKVHLCASGKPLERLFFYWLVKLKLVGAAANRLQERLEEEEEVE